MKILKFGGTSVGTVEALQNLKQIVLQEKEKGEPLLVVCSALSKITNTLTESAELALNQGDYETLVTEIEQRHYGLIKELMPVSAQNPLLMMVRTKLNKLEDLLSSVQHLGELSDRTKAAIIANGEQLSGPIVASFLNLDQPAEFKDAKDLIQTDAQYLKGSVDFEVTNRQIREWQKTLEDKIYVLSGFVAATENGVTTTLGRGGSDYTASIFGAALSVDEVQIWTNVNGFMTADPNLVENAYSLPYLSYHEAMELSYFGAKVIYPPSLIPVVAMKIPVRIKNTLQPEQVGTLIHLKKEALDKALITGITSMDRVALVNIMGSGMIGLKGFSARLFNLLYREDINIILITQASSEHSISLVIQTEDAQKAAHALEKEFAAEIRWGRLQRPEIDTGVSIVAIVGERMRHTRGLSGKLFNTLGRNGINVMAIAQGSSELNISTVISQEDLPRAMNVIHDAFLLSPVRTYHVFVAGTGNIGTEFLNQIKRQSSKLKEEYHIEIKLLGIANTRRMVFSNGTKLENDRWEEQLEAHGQKADFEAFMQRVKMNTLPNTVFVDNTSSAVVASQYEDLFESGVSVVTCNKISNSGSFERYRKLKETAAAYGVSFLYETNVGAGLPIIGTLDDLVMSGDEIQRIEAILSGTISYIFNNYTGDRKFAEVVKEAQDLGYTEPDPREDLGGGDFSRKMLILARECGLKLEPSDVEITDFLPKECLEAADVADFYQKMEEREVYFEGFKKEAEASQKKLRMIGEIENGKIRIRVEAVDATHPFYNLSGNDNIISFKTNRYRNTPLVVRGPGAGAEVTAAGVFADLIKVITL